MDRPCLFLGVALTDFFYHKVRGLEEVIGENRLRFDQVNAENQRLQEAMQALEESSGKDKRKVMHELD